jgi:hypothetical protein
MRRINPDSSYISTLFEQAFIRRFHGPKTLLNSRKQLFQERLNTARTVTPRVKIHHYVLPIISAKNARLNHSAETILRTVKTSSAPLRPKRAEICKITDLTYF